MSHDKSKTPKLERTQTISPSPARNALKGHLDVTSTEPDQSLKKKKSWFNSFRDAFSKSALQAKAAVDSFRGDQHQTDQKRDADCIDESDFNTRPSIDSVTSTSAPPNHELRLTFTSNPAIASLREHLPRHTARLKRTSIYSITERSSNEHSELAGPERYASPPLKDEGSGTHKRSTSVARSLVGSIRGLGRKTGMSRPATPAKDIPIAKPAENVPLPSSPIDIPVSAPALDLDLGPASLMSPTFNRTTDTERSHNALKLTDPTNFTSGLPKASLPQEMEAKSYRSTTPADFLRLSLDGFNNSSINPPPGPTTPMPGTNLGMELDGAKANSPADSRVFERSVTPPNEKERKELRTMRSLDAMAEACTIAHANDELRQASEMKDNQSDVIAVSPEDEALPAPKIKPSLRRNIASASTADDCPSDMEELTRQKTVDMEPPNTQQNADMEEESNDTEVSATNHDLGIGPPSPVRRVKLPFRPKVTSEVVEAAAEFVKRTDESRNEDSEAKPDEGSQVPLSPIASETSLEGQLQLERNYAAAQAYADTEEKPNSPEPTDDTQASEHVASDDDIFSRTQELLGSDVILPNYDGIDSDPDEGMSPHGGPLVAQLYHRISSSQTPSPRSIRSRTTYTAGLGDAEYQFSFDKWLHTSSGAADPDIEAKTPPRRSMDMSIDSVSTTDERQTPQISPRSTNPDHTPSMGNRVEFELKRSERNMRFNALNQEDRPEVHDIEELPDRPPLRFFIAGSEETDGYAFQLADFESAYVSSRENSPQKKVPPQAHVRSEESLADSLENAASGYRQLEERLTSPSDVDLPTRPTGLDFDSVMESDDEMPAQDLEKRRELRSDAPSPEKRQPDPTSSSTVRGLDPNDFSPTSARDNGSPIRFTGLEVMESTPSPDQVEPPEHNATKALPGESPLDPFKLFPKQRVGSADTLDQSLELFSSPDSGYLADKSSDSQDSENTKAPKAAPARYRNRRDTAKPLDEVSGNKS